MEKNSFKEITQYYDLLVDWKVRLEREEPFFRSLFGEKSVKILDAACGTGRHAALFASMGHNVTGSDVSPEVLKVAKKNAGDLKISFYREDLTDLNTGFKGDSFDFVTAIGNTLAIINEREKIENVFRKVNYLLRPGGTFIFQIVNFTSQTVINDRFTPFRSVIDNKKEYIFQRFFDICDDKVVLNLLVFIKENDKWIRNIESTQLMPWSINDLKSVSERSGFSSVKFYGDYLKTPFDENSRDILGLAVK